MQYGTNSAANSAKYSKNFKMPRFGLASWHAGMAGYFQDIFNDNILTLKISSIRISIVQGHST